ncbi:MAG: hypothetical protein NUV47_02940 [Patescibacteria group bacterium]|nr:hypothetical protein [Patescibacteria group bacterium]
MKKIIPYLSLVIFLIALLFPILEVYLSVNTAWQGVTPGYNDSVYYYSRMHEVKDDNPFIGNPFLLEHNKELAPAFFVADWVAVAPLFVGLSFTQTVVFDMIFWSIIFVLFLFLFLKQLGLTKEISSVVSVLVYFSVYSLMMRAVSMQIVFPFFAFFLFAFAYWLNKSKVHKSAFTLILATTFSFYIYTYLWQITSVVLFISVIAFFVIGHKVEAKRLCLIIFSSLLLASPVFIYGIKQVENPFYWESMQRIGLVNTHLLASNVFYSGFWVLVIMFFWYIIKRQIKKINDVLFNNAYFLVVASGLAMLVASTSNLITGKELENSQHIERFIIVWFIGSLGTILFYIYKYKENFYNLSKKYKFVLLILFLVSLFGAVKYFNNYFIYFSVTDELKSQSLILQRYAPPLNWLEKNVNEQSVVWTDSTYLIRYVPIMTKHYLLFTPGTSHLHLLSDKELEERYLVYSYFNDLSLEDIKERYRDFAGVGNAVHQYKTYNRKVTLCKILKFDFWGINCGELTDNVSFKGEAYFTDLYNWYSNDIKNNISFELKKYNVSYAVKDKEFDSPFRPDTLPRSIKVYENEDFIVYKLN